MPKRDNLRCLKFRVNTQVRTTNLAD